MAQVRSGELDGHSAVAQHAGFPTAWALNHGAQFVVLFHQNVCVHNAMTGEKSVFIDAPMSRVGGSALALWRGRDLRHTLVVFGSPLSLQSPDITSTNHRPPPDIC